MDGRTFRGLSALRSRLMKQGSARDLQILIQTLGYSSCRNVYTRSSVYFLWMWAQCGKNKDFTLHCHYPSFQVSETCFQYIGFFSMSSINDLLRFYSPRFSLME